MTRLLRWWTVAAAVAVGLGPTPAMIAEERLPQLLVVGMSADWQHESTSEALATLYELGRESGLWETTIRTDVQLVTKQEIPRNGRNLDFFDAVFFMTSGELPLDNEQKAALLEFVVEDGKGFLGAHSASDTLHGWPAYGDLIGGYFDGHPWNQLEATIRLDDREFVATRHFPESWRLFDEFYQIKEFRSDGTRILMSLDTDSVDMGAEGVTQTEIPITWTRQVGKGQVFYTSLGHEPAVWARDDVRAMWLEAVKWAMRLE